jgi:hypothetical protein
MITVRVPILNRLTISDLGAVYTIALISRTLRKYGVFATGTSEPTSHTYHDLEILTFDTIRASDDFSCDPLPRALHGEIMH